ncbi:MAG TPA: mycothiol synthase [Egibacteraceae bacterium]|jgi:mycothiol synthase|nr:mycothiol synthase [Egibacteraceae bacterium]
MVRIQVSATLDEPLLVEVRALIDEVTRLEGHAPVGEHKYAHLVAGARDWTGVLAHEGDDLVGYAHVRWNAAGARPRAAAEVVVRPDREDREALALRLLDATQTLIARTGGGPLFLWVRRVADARSTLAARAGFGVQRELLLMTRALPDRPAVERPPEGVTLRAYRPGADDGALLRVNNAAFVGHPEQGGWDRSTLEQRRRQPWFSAEGVILAWGADDLLGFHWTKWHGHDAGPVAAHEPVGEVYVLAVDPAAQGRGLGRLLLAAGLAHLHDRGCRQAILYVDASHAGPVALYRSAGFTAVSTEVCYEKKIPPAGVSREDLLRPA